MDETTETAKSKDIRLIGVATHQAKGPVQPFWMNLEPGVAVIYGRNGSGKTFALRTIVSAGTEPHTTLYLKCLPPSREDSADFLFWGQSDLEGLMTQQGFHDDMFNFLNEAEMYWFIKYVELVCLEFIQGVIQANLEDAKVFGDLDPHVTLQQIGETVELLRNKQNAWPKMKKLGYRVNRILTMTSSVAYRNEFWNFSDELKDGLIVQVLKMIMVGQTFVVQNKKLQIVESRNTGLFGTICKDNEIRELDYMELVHEWGYGLAELIDNWNSQEGKMLSPWDGPMLATGLKDPRWGRAIADVDLDQQNYRETIVTSFLNDFSSIMQKQRGALTEDDPRYLDFWDNTGHRSLVHNKEGATSWDVGAVELIREITIKANLIYSRFLEQAPNLECIPNPINDWSDLTPFSWNVSSPSGGRLPFSELSWAEQRWASMAIRIATPSENLPLQLLVIDEPERGLHRRAERNLASALQDLSLTENLTCVVATHSPVFLGLQHARLHHLWKSPDGTSTLDTLPTDIEPWANELGLDKTDLLQLCRLFLIVEGEHDAIILNSLFKEEFSRHGVHVVPLRGLRNITNATDASFIFRYTEASVLYLTDNDNHQRVANIWNKAVNADPANHLEIIGEFVSSRGTAEGQFLKEFASLALNFSAKNRINFTALPAEDILDYLPAKTFVPEAASWADLRKKWGQPKNGNFKKWLSDTYGPVFDNFTITNAVESLDSIPTDLVELLGVVIETATAITPIP